MNKIELPAAKALVDSSRSATNSQFVPQKRRSRPRSFSYLMIDCDPDNCDTQLVHSVSLPAVLTAMPIDEHEPVSPSAVDKYKDYIARRSHEETSLANVLSLVDSIILSLDEWNS